MRLPLCGRIWLATLLLAASVACEEKAATSAPPAPLRPGPVRTEPVRVEPRIEPPLPEITNPTCGQAGMPECPLQLWMDHHLSGPLSREDYSAVADAFRRLGAAAPAGFTGWAAWADGGALAASRRDFAAVNRACTGCHDTYRPRFRRTLRERALPGLPAEPASAP